nr:hypothetical protein [Flavobacteriales bacterium]
QPGSPFIMAGFPVETVREILAQNKEGIEPEVDLNMVDEPLEIVKAPDYENVVGQDELTRFDNKTSKRRSKKKGRGNRDRNPGEVHVRDQQNRGGEQGQRDRNPRPQGPPKNGPEGQAQGQRSARPEGQQGGARPEGQQGDRPKRSRNRNRPRGPKGPDAPKPPAA